jgi:hypothetical protein
MVKPTEIDRVTQRYREIAPLLSVANSKQEFRHYPLPRVVRGGVGSEK